MKGNTLNKQLTVLMFLLLNCFVSCSEDDNMILKTVTINLTEAGTLPDKISSSNKNKITNLKIIGDINGTDLRFIREMAGKNVIGYNNSGNLSKLDLSKAWIVEGGEAYYHNKDNYYYSSNNQLGCYAFEGCFLTSINIPLSVTSIGDDALSWTSLENINIPSSVTSIGRCAFGYCGHLKSVNIPSSVTEIGKAAFEDCRSLESIKIPSNVTKIGYSAFHDCKSLRAIYVYAEKVPILPYNSRAFEGCDSKKCKVYVPIGTYDAYSRSQFGYFENIVEFDATSFRNTIATAENQDTTH